MAHMVVYSHHKLTEEEHRSICPDKLERALHALVQSLKKIMPRKYSGKDPVVDATQTTDGQPGAGSDLQGATPDSKN